MEKKTVDKQTFLQRRWFDMIFVIIIGNFFRDKT